MEWHQTPDPRKTGDPGRTGRNNRLFVNAVLFILKTGIPREDLPDRYGKANTVWKRYDRWCAKGVWEQLFRALGESELMEDLEEVQIDSSSIKAHAVASTGRRQRGKKRRGRSETLSGTFPWWTDDEGSRGHKPERTPD